MPCILLLLLLLMLMLIICLAHRTHIGQEWRHLQGTYNNQLAGFSATHLICLTLATYLWFQHMSDRLFHLSSTITPFLANLTS